MRAPLPRFQLPIVIAAVAIGWIAGSFRRDTGQHPNTAGTPRSVEGVPTCSPVTAVADATYRSEADARSAIGNALQLPIGLNRRRELLGAVARLQIEHIPSVLETALRVPYPDPEELLTLVGTRWAELNPVAAMTYVQSQPRWPDQRELRSAAMEVWLARDEPAAIAWSLSQPASPKRSALLDTLASIAARQSFSGAVGIYNRLTGDGERRDFAEVIVRERRGEEPTRFAASLPAGQTRDYLIRTALNNWAREDGKAAFAWLVQAPPEFRSWGAFDQLAMGWAATDPRAAAEAWMASEASKDERAALTLGSIAAAWFAKEPAPALAWVQSLPQSDFRHNATIEIVRSTAESDPRRAAEIADTLQGEERRIARMQVDHPWAEREPEAAAQWVLRWDDAKERETGLHSVAWAWCRANLDSAARWAQTLPAGRERDAAASGISASLAESDVRAAADWAAKIANPEVRTNAITNVAQCWVEVDVDAARGWIENRPELSTEAKAKLLPK